MRASGVYERVLVAVDQSECAVRAVRVARDLARLSGGSGLILHVVPVVRSNPGGLVNLETKKSVKSLISRARSTFDEDGIEVSSQLRSAEIPKLAHEITAAATEFDADVIVMGCSGDAATTTLVPGSVTHAVLHLAQRPVLVVP